MYLIDANIIIRYINGDLSKKSRGWIEKNTRNNLVHISAITRTEVLAKPGISPEIFSNTQEVLDLFILHTVTKEIADLAGFIRSRFGLGLGDSIVSATGLHFNLPVVTEDLRGFHNVQGLTVLRLEEI